MRRNRRPYCCRSGKAQHGSEPKAQHLAPQSVFARTVQYLIRQCEQARNFTFAGKYALTLNLSRMCREHRRHYRARKPINQLCAANACFFGAQQRSGETTLAFARLHSSAVFGRIGIFSDIDQMQKVAEGANDVERLVDGKAIERFF
jgi:hypothetical protein